VDLRCAFSRCGFAASENAAKNRQTDYYDLIFLIFPNAAICNYQEKPHMHTKKRDKDMRKYQENQIVVIGSAKNVRFS